MKIATWNLYNRPLNPLLIETHRPDVLLLQEWQAGSYAQSYPGYQVAFAANAGAGQGVGILVADHLQATVEPAPLPGYGGYVVGARVQAEGADIMVYGLHVHTPHYVKQALAIVEAAGRQATGMPMIIGGDWNCTISEPVHSSYDAEWPGSKQVRTLLAGTLGMTNAYRYCHPTAPLPRTFRQHRKPESKAFHIDGFWVSGELAAGIRTCKVLEEQPWLDSDHNPVVLELAL